MPIKVWQQLDDIYGADAAINDAPPAPPADLSQIVADLEGVRHD